MKVVLALFSIMAFGEGSILHYPRRGRAYDGQTERPPEKDSVIVVTPEIEDKGCGWGTPTQYGLVGISHSPVFGWENGAVGWTPIGWITVKPQTCSGWSPASTSTTTQTITQTGWVWDTSTRTSTLHQIYTSTTFLTGWAWPSTSSILATMEILPTFKVSYVTVTNTETFEAPTPTTYQAISTTSITVSYTTSTITTTSPYSLPSSTETELTTEVSTLYTSISTEFTESTTPISTETVTQYSATTIIPTTYFPSVTCINYAPKQEPGGPVCTTLSTFETITRTITGITIVTSLITASGTQYIASFNPVSPTSFTITETAFENHIEIVPATSTMTNDLTVKVVTSTFSLPSGQSTVTVIPTTDFCTLTKIVTVSVTTTPSEVTSWTTEISFVDGEATVTSTVFTNVIIPTTTETLTETVLGVSTITRTFITTTTPTTTTISVTDIRTIFDGITYTIATSTIIVDEMETRTSTHFVTSAIIETTETTEDAPQTAMLFGDNVKLSFTYTRTDVVTTVTVAPTEILTASKIILSVPCSTSGGGWITGWGGWSGGWREEQEDDNEEFYSATTPLPLGFGSI